MTVYTDEWRRNCGRWAKFRAANHELQGAAIKRVQTAIRSGRLVRQPCVICGTDKQVEAHHEDYAKPLEVVWLCRWHHAQRHQNQLPELDKETA